MLMVVLVMLAVCSLFVALRFLHLANQAAAPTLYCKPTADNCALIQACPLLSECYVPPLLWGKSGHLQTFIYGKLGRVKSPFPQGERISIRMPDGATMTFDLFEPHTPHKSGDDFTLLLCPGLANSSESVYICTCVDYAQNAGYRVAVLNHMGALKKHTLTAPRIFTYGGTAEFGTMVDRVQDMYPSTKLMAVGFSMGGNIVLKYVGESPENQAKILAAMSFCQGYDAAEAAKYLLSWEHMRRVYLWAMTLHQMSVLRYHKDVLLSPEAQAKYGLDVERIMASQTLADMDESYSRRRAGFNSAMDYYKWASCRQYLKNITIPTLLVNTIDDPIIPEELLHTPRDLAMTNRNVIFATLEHGGHLGFFEGGIAIPETITWLDKMVVQYADAIAVTMTQQANTASKAM